MTNNVYSSTAAYSAAVPLDFTLLNQYEQPTLYIFGSDSGQSLKLEVINTSQLQYTLSAHDEGVVSDQIYCFELRFRPGTLDQKTDTRITISDSNWRVMFYHNDNDGSDSLFLLNVNAIQLDPRGILSLSLGNIFVSSLGGARNTRVEFHYSNVVSPSQTTINGTCTQNLQILHGESQPQSPFDIRFLGSNRVLNDGNTSSSISVGVSCGLNLNSIPLSANEDYGKSKITLRIEIGDQTQKNQTLTTSDNALNINIACNNNQWEFIVPSGQEQDGQWTFQLNSSQDIELIAGQELAFTLSNIKTDFNSGFTKLYIFYDNIPDYADGMEILEIEKAPLLFLPSCKVGVATNNATSVLNVKGDVHIANGNLLFANSASIQSLNSLHEIAFNSDALTFNEQNNIKFTSGYKSFNTPPVLFLSKNSNVGIGTETPGAKLTIANGQLQVTESTNRPSSGAGVEIGYEGSIGKIRGYDRDRNQYKKLQLESAQLDLFINETKKFSLDSSSVTIANGFKVQDGYTVSGIPVIDFKIQNFSDTKDDNTWHDSKDFTFSSNVIQAQAFIAGWYLHFTNGPHEMQAGGVQLRDTSISGNTVTVSVQFTWEHQTSDNHNVDYDVDVVVIAMLEKSFTPSSL